MKTRIKVVEYKNGTKRYYPEYRIAWYYDWRNYTIDIGGTEDVYFDTEEEAQIYIDKEIADQIEKESFIDYP